MSKSLAIKRILKDLIELEDNLQKGQIKGISCAMPNDDNPFALFAYMEIQYGIYTSLRLHFTIQMP